MDGWEWAEQREGAVGPDPARLKRLARELVRAAGDDWTAAVLAIPSSGLRDACRRLGYDYPSVASALRELCPKVRVEDPGRFRSACDWASIHWRGFMVAILPEGKKFRGEVTGLWKRRCLVAALVYRLCGKPSRSGWALVDGAKIAAWLGVKKSDTATGILNWLAHDGDVDEEHSPRTVIEFELNAEGKPAYSYMARESRRAKYIGPGPGPVA